MTDGEALKKEAGIAACSFVKTGMKVGLGTWSLVGTCLASRASSAGKRPFHTQRALDRRHPLQRSYGATPDGQQTLPTARKSRIYAIGDARDVGSLPC